LQKHCDAVSACVELGLRRFENAYASKKLSSSIPPGWKDVAHKGLRDALKGAAEFGDKRAAADLGRRVDPKDPNARNGTANVAFAHGRKAQARDLSPFGLACDSNHPRLAPRGLASRARTLRSLRSLRSSVAGHWHAFLIHLFSSGVKVSGPDVRVMMECWCVPPPPRHGCRAHVLSAPCRGSQAACV
jgi:hypothetical protein